MVQPNSSTNALDPILQRGAGYVLPIDSSFRALEHFNTSGGEGDGENGSSSYINENEPVTAGEIVDSINYFHDMGVHPHTICFGGGRSEPLSTLDVVLEAMHAVREQRHGTPIVVQTNGLPPSSSSPNDENHVNDLISINKQWRDAPGSDGDSKLSVWVNIAASNPPEYDKVMQPQNMKPGLGFQKVCGFVTGLTDGGVRTIGTASKVPKVNMKQVKSVSMSLGCSDFFERSYHPHTLYDTLGLSNGGDDGGCVTEESIKAAYLQKAKELHPDLHQGKEVDGMADVVEAYSVLGDKLLRKKYEQGVADLVLNEHEDDIYSSVVNKSL